MTGAQQSITEIRRSPSGFSKTLILNGAPPIECPVCNGEENIIGNSERDMVRYPYDEQHPNNWKVLFVRPKTQYFSDQISPGSEPFGQDDLIRTHGVQDLVIFPDETSQEAMYYLLKALVLRTDKLSKQNPAIRYALLTRSQNDHENGHRHATLVGSEDIPPSILDEIAAAKKYWGQKERCLYCDEVFSMTKDNPRYINHNDGAVSYVPFAPSHNLEACISPKGHAVHIETLGEDQLVYLTEMMADSIQRLNASDPSPFGFYIHTGPMRQRCVPLSIKGFDDYYHMHVVVFSGEQIDMFHGSGWRVIKCKPEETAQMLRNA